MDKLDHVLVCRRNLAAAALDSAAVIGTNQSRALNRRETISLIKDI